MLGTVSFDRHYRLQTSVVPFVMYCFLIGLEVVLIVFIGAYIHEHLHADSAPWSFTLAVWALGLSIYLLGVTGTKAPSQLPRLFVITNESISVRQGRSFQRIPINKVRLCVLDERLTDLDTPCRIALWGNGIFLQIPTNIAHGTEIKSLILSHNAAQTKAQIREGYTILRAERLLQSLERCRLRLILLLLLAALFGTLFLMLPDSEQNAVGKSFQLCIAIGSSFLCLLLWERAYWLKHRKQHIENDMLASLTKRSIPFLIEKLHLFCDPQRFDVWQCYGARQALATIIPALPQTDRLELPARSYLRIYTLLCPKRNLEWRQALKSCLDPENLEDALIASMLAVCVFGLCMVIPFLDLLSDFLMFFSSAPHPATLTEQENAFQDHQTRRVLLQLLAKTGQHHTLPVLQSFLADSEADLADSILAKEAENCIEAITRRLQAEKNRPFSWALSSANEEQTNPVTKAQPAQRPRDEGGIR
jgi:hypothetical protein